MMSENKHDSVKPSKKLLDNAYKNYREKDYGKALALFRRLNSVDGKIGIARCYIKQNKNEEVLTLLKDINLEGLNDSENRQLLHTMSIAYDQQGKFAEAAEYLKKIKDQDNADVLYAWARWYDGQKKYDEAIEKYITIKNKYKHVNCYLSHAVVLHLTERYEETITSLTALCGDDEQEIKKQFPRMRSRQQAAAFVITSITYNDIARKKDNDKKQLAMVYAKRATKINPNYAIAWAVLGHCYQERNKNQDDVKKAAVCFEKARCLDPQRFSKNHPFKELPVNISTISLDDDLFNLDDYLFKRLRNILNQTNSSTEKITAPDLHTNIAYQSMRDGEDNESASLILNENFESMFPPLTIKSEDKQEKNNNLGSTYKMILMSIDNKKTEKILSSKMNDVEWWGEKESSMESIPNNVVHALVKSDQDDFDVPESWEDEYEDSVSQDLVKKDKKEEGEFIENISSDRHEDHSKMSVFPLSFELQQYSKEPISDAPKPSIMREEHLTLMGSSDKESDQNNHHNPCKYLTSMIYGALNNCRALLFDSRGKPEVNPEEAALVFKKNL